MITEETYQEYRKQTLKDYLLILRKQDISEDNLPSDLPNFSCDNCPIKLSCEFSADMYNTDGDCLADK